jgi:hypothetical protein
VEQFHIIFVCFGGELPSFQATTQFPNSCFSCTERGHLTATKLQANEDRNHPRNQTRCAANIDLNVEAALRKLDSSVASSAIFLKVMFAFEIFLSSLLFIYFEGSF